jgi:hypothetical protein
MGHYEGNTMKRIFGKPKTITPELEEIGAPLTKPKDEPQTPRTAPSPLDRKPKEAIMPVKIMRVGGRRLWLAGIGVAIAGVSFIGIANYSTTLNMAVGFVSIMAFAGGAVCIYLGLKNQDAGVVLSPASKMVNGKLVTAPKFLANSLNIYPNQIVFEELPLEALHHGQLRKCRNDNKYYYVHIWGTAFGGKEEKLNEFLLPDTQYRDPREFANNINIPAHRRLAMRKESLLQKLSPVLIIAGMGIVALLIITTSPQPLPPGTVPAALVLRGIF